MRLLANLVLCCAVLSIHGCDQTQPSLPGSGQWRVVNYWAIWCTPCREEIPELNALSRDTSLVVLSVNYDNKQGDTLREHASELGIEFRVLEQDPGPMLGIDRPRVLPTTLLINPQGAITDTLIGPQTQETLLALWEIRLRSE
ncbi:MAG: TlpA disulfide reductase family protein [Luminiphilus sp.]|jgi:thiol-disulfide isomerase/thioredoxin|nr:TlpA disulfide reductase family protein [Luminiphilus sp.]